MCLCVMCRRVDCLRQLIIVLTEQNKLQELCEFKYTGLEREVGVSGISCDWSGGICACHVIDQEIVM